MIKYLWLVILNLLLILTASADSKSQLAVLEKQMMHGIQSGNADSAIIYYLKAERLSGSNFPGTMARINLSLAGFLESKGVYSQALICRQKALRFMEKADAMDNEPVGRFFCISDIGGLFLRLDQKDSALSYYNAAYKLAESGKNNFLKIHAQNNLAYWYSTTGRRELAIQHYQTALTLFNEDKSVKDSALFGVINGNIALELFRKKQYDEALPFLEINVKFSLQNDHILKHQCQLAAPFLRDVEQLAIEKNLLNDLPECYRLQAESCLGMNQLEQAKIWLVRYKDIAAKLNKKTSTELRKTIDALGQQQLRQLEKELSGQQRVAREKEALLRSQQQTINYILFKCSFP